MSKREFRLEDEHHYNRSGPVRWIVSHVTRYPLFPLAAILAAVLNNLAYSYRQILVGRGFDLITTPGWQRAGLVTLALGAIASAVAQGVTGLARNFSAEVLAQRIERDARDELYASLLGKSQTFHGQQRIGDIMARATNDVRALNWMFNPGLMLILDSLMAAVVPIALISQLEWRLLLVPLAFVVLLAVTVADYNRRLKPVSMAQREQFGTMNAGLAEAVAGIEVVKANAQERHEWKRFARNARRFRDYFVQQGEIQARYLPMLAFTLAWAGGFLHALLLWQAGIVSLGQVVAFMGLLGSLRFPTFISIFSFNLVQLGVASAGRILELINTETELDENEAGVTRPVRGEVVFDRVSFGYNGKPVLKDVSFAARPGETIAIVGQTGSGKTTLTRLINRIFDADGGRVLVDGVDVRDWSLASLRSQVSTIEQDVFLFSRTLAENVAFGRADATPEAIERGGARGAGARVRHRVRRRLRHRGRRARGDALGRAAAAGRHRPRLPHRPAHPDPGRLDERDRQRDGGPDPARDAAHQPPADDVHHHPPAEPDPLGRPHPRPAEGRAGGSGDARGADGAECGLPAHLCKV